MLTQEAIFIATIKGTSLVIKTRPLDGILYRKSHLRILSDFYTQQSL